MPQSIRIALRVRPPPDINSYQFNKQDKEKFNEIFNVHATNKDIYSKCGDELVTQLFEGMNGCIFAYGQTSSGKTHTMLGKDGANSSNTNLNGIIPQLSIDIFNRIKDQENDSRIVFQQQNMTGFQLQAHYIEVYKGNVYDLLGKNRKVLKVRENKSEGDAYMFPKEATHVYIKNTKDLITLIKAGSKNRQTKSTGQNQHSSRSHAILTLTLEKRWRGNNLKKKNEYNSRTSRLMLIDLAGSESAALAHNGAKDDAGTSINLGLLALSKVCRALSQSKKNNSNNNRNNNSQHVPYRDSQLTRIMSTCLSGNCLTWMIACINPIYEIESDNTKAFACQMNMIKTEYRKTSIVKKKVFDPLENDEEDPIQNFNRRTCWIKTKYGNIHARCAGSPRNPLLLMVHGSGPKNSSLSWNWLVLDMLRNNQKYYYVAIDCPGYGRSLGDRQIIRSYPSEFLSNVIFHLGKKSAYGLFGCSQGAAATFNAVLEVPLITKYIAVYHPVGFEPSRYTAITQPTFLLFDTEDHGHPVKVGRLMRKYLQDPYYFEFTSSTDTDNWIGYDKSSRMCKELIKMMGPTKCSTNEKAKIKDKKSVKLAGGINRWFFAINWENEAYQLDPKCIKCILSTDDNDDDDEWQIVVDKVTNELMYHNCRTNKYQKNRPNKFKSEAPSNYMMEYDNNSNKKEPDKLFIDVKKQQQEKSTRQKQYESTQKKCDRCNQILKGTIPFRIRQCRHLFCATCTQKRLLPFRNCPICSIRINKAKLDIKPDKVLFDQFNGNNNNLNEKTLDNALMVLSKLEQQQKTPNCFDICLEIGTTAKKSTTSNSSKPKYKQTTYLRTRSISQWKSKKKYNKKDIIDKVEFNINPSYEKPTEILKNTGKCVYSHTQNLNFAFSCFTTVHFNPVLDMKPLRLVYYTQIDEPDYSYKINLSVFNRSKDAKKKMKRFRRKDDVMEYNVNENGEGVIFYDVKSQEVEFLHGDALLTL